MAAAVIHLKLHRLDSVSAVYIIQMPDRLAVRTNRVVSAADNVYRQFLWNGIHRLLCVYGAESVEHVIEEPYRTGKSAPLISDIRINILRVAAEPVKFCAWIFHLCII